MSNRVKLIDKFDFAKEYILENELVKIIPLQLQHIELLQPIAENEEIWTFFLNKGNDKKKFEEYCSKALALRKKAKEYPFVIHEKKSGKLVGMTSLYDYQEQLKVIKMGNTWLGKFYWGKNLNKHCKYLMFEFIFDRIDLERIGFGVHGQNTRSINALKNIGCLQEGVLRYFLPSIINTSRVDLFLFSILNKEWKSTVKAKLHSKLK